jgi:hypothetical protein
LFIFATDNNQIINKMQKRLFILAVVLLMVSVAAIAQVTTSGITGIVMADGEEAI